MFDEVDLIFVWFVHSLEKKEIYFPFWVGVMKINVTFLIERKCIQKTFLFAQIIKARIVNEGVVRIFNIAKSRITIHIADTFFDTQHTGGQVHKGQGNLKIIK